MKILLSAFNCNPDKGSEYGRGWAWVIELTSAGHEIWVITEAQNQPAIERFLAKNPIPNCNFIYHPLAPSSNAWWKFKGKQIGALNRRFEIEWQLFMWQWQAYQRTKELVQQVDFDYVHHVTNTCVRRFSFMGFLGIPFILGPLSGGLSTPWKLRKSYPPMGWIIELLRDFSNGLVQLNPLMRLTFAKASRIYCDSEETLLLLPKFCQHKAQVLFSLATPKLAKTHSQSERTSIEKEDFEILFVGRFMFWKGIHLALRAFADFHQKMPNSRFTIIGSGAEEKRLRRYAEQLGIQNAVHWQGWINQQELSLAYQQHDVLLFPSLHDTSPNVVLESFCFGLPVVCLDLGGCRVMVDDSCGRVIETANLTETEVAQKLDLALLEIAQNSELRQQLGQNALLRKDKFNWNHILQKVYPKTASEPVSLSQSQTI